MPARACLAIAIAAAPCGGKTDAPNPGQPSPSASPGDSGISGGDASVLPPGWRREDLARQPEAPLAASIAVPAAAKVTSSRVPDRDADGLAITVPTVIITGDTTPIELTTRVVLGAMPTTAAADLADNARRVRPFVVADTKQTATGEWAIAYQAPPQNTAVDQCFVRGWSPRAKVLCGTVGPMIPCAEIATPMTMCISLEPSGPEIAAASDAAAAFPRVADPQAAEAAVAVARAISRNDRDAILATVGAKGMMLKGKRVSPKALRALLAGDTVQRAFEMPCKPPPDHRASLCAWIAEGGIENNALAILANDGTGLVPRFTLTKGAGGRWLLSHVDLADLGPP